MPPKHSLEQRQRQTHLLLYPPLSLEDAHTEDEGEEQLVLFKEGAAHVAVDAVGKMVVQVEDTFLYVLRWGTVDNGLKTQNS
jgi:hypothetical protein